MKELYAFSNLPNETEIQQIVGFVGREKKSPNFFVSDTHRSFLSSPHYEVLVKLNTDPVLLQTATFNATPEHDCKPIFPHPTE